MLVGSCSPCCGGGSICDAPPPYLRITISGMPSVIDGGESLGYAARSPFDENGFEWTLYRTYADYYGTLSDCQWLGAVHSHINKLNAMYVPWGVFLHGRQNRLYAYGFIFEPPEGASFTQVPYTDERPLVVVGKYASGFGAESDWSSVVVEIHVGKSGDAQTACFTSGYGSICNTEEDLGTSMIITPCTAAALPAVSSVDDLQVSVTVNCLFTHRRTIGIPYLGATEWTEFNPAGVTNGTLDFFNGDYDLSWSDIAHGARPEISQYGAPNGWQLVSQGYGIFERNEALVGFFSFDPNGVYGSSANFWLGIAVRPTAFLWTGAANTTPSLSRCGNGELSWGVRCALFDTAYTGDGPYPGQFVAGAFASTPCDQYSCGEAPSFQSVSMSGEIDVVLNRWSSGPYENLRGNVTFTVSAS